VYSNVYYFMKATLIQQYITQTLEHSQTPSSVYLFAKAAGIDEQSFYVHFSGLEALEMEIYEQWFNDAYTQCAASEPWNTYSAREKVLSVFYTFIETLKPNRSFVKFLKDRDFKALPKWPSYLNKLKDVFVGKMRTIIHEGLDSKELAERKYIDDKYVDGLWVNFLFVLKFWIDDTSTGFEKTDAAIEKSVNLSMDLMGKSALDAALDFGKFLFQNR
jgi:AcrR family transcriptional regulator